MSPGTCHRCNASSELKGLLPDKVLCFHLENIRYAKTLLGSSFSIQKVRIWTAVRQLSSHVIEHGPRKNDILKDVSLANVRIKWSSRLHKILQGFQNW